MTQAIQERPLLNSVGFTPADEARRRRVNTVQAAEIAGVTKRTIFNWMRAGYLEVDRTPTGGVRIYADTLLRKAT